MINVKVCLYVTFFRPVFFIITLALSPVPMEPVTLMTRERTYITRIHSSRMRTTRLLIISRSISCVSEEGSAQSPCPPDADPPDADQPGGRPSGHVTCDACWEANPPLPPPVNRMVHRCENITLPQTSFAGGNNGDNNEHGLKNVTRK